MDSSLALIAVSLGSSEEDEHLSAALVELLGPDIEFAATPTDAEQARVRFVTPSALTTNTSRAAALVVTDADLTAIATMLVERPSVSHVLSPSVFERPGEAALAPRIIRHLLLGGGGPAALVEGPEWTITAPEQRDDVLSHVLASAARNGAKEAQQEAICGAVRELLDNALRASAVQLGLAIGPAEAFVLPVDKAVRVVTGRIGSTFLASVTDRFGAFDRAQLVSALRRGAAAEAFGTTIVAPAPGLWKLLRAAQHLLVRVEPREATELVVGFDLNASPSGSPRSLHLLFGSHLPSAPLEPPSDLDSVVPARGLTRRGAVRRGEPKILEGRYELLDLVSSGGMGSVYRARHRHLDRLVAV